MCVMLRFPGIAWYNSRVAVAIGFAEIAAPIVVALLFIAAVSLFREPN